MGAQANAAPVIIKRKKVISGGGHHGGAWKVAYADFVTAMMAFFMLMWLLNATTEKQRKGIADYFSPTIPLSRVSGGGEGSFGGESVFSEDQIAQNGTGASSLRPTEERQALGQTGIEPADAPVEAGRFEEVARRIEKALLGLGGESLAQENALRHINTRVTDEGLIVEAFEREGAPLFAGEAGEPTTLMRDIAAMVARVFALARNEVAVAGHLSAVSAMRREYPAWTVSADRALAVRALLEAGGIAPRRMQRVTGYADRRPALANPAAPGNNRIEMILLRRGPPDG
jgi:chemotaxis protein MotB